MTTRTIAALLTALSSAACAAGGEARMAPMAAYEAPPPAAPPAALERSLFVPIGGARLTEDQIGHILDAPVELKLPARVGVVSLERGFSPGAPDRIGQGLPASRALAKKLEETGLVAVASEVSRELPTGSGVEGLRELAARYRAPYLVLYTERWEDQSRMNGWGALWVTLVGGFVAPNRTVAGEGVIEASLLDVRTGTVLFTVQESVAFEGWSLALSAETAWEEERREAASKAAELLSERVVERWQRLARASKEEAGAAAAKLPVAPVPAT